MHIIDKKESKIKKKTKIKLKSHHKITTNLPQKKKKGFCENVKKCDVSSSIQFIYMKPIHNKCFLKAFYKKNKKN